MLLAECCDVLMVHCTLPSGRSHTSHDGLLTPFIQPVLKWRLQKHLGGSSGLLQGALQRAHWTWHSHVVIGLLQRCVIVPCIDEMECDDETVGFTSEKGVFCFCLQVGCRILHQHLWLQAYAQGWSVASLISLIFRVHTSNMVLSETEVAAVPLPALNRTLLTLGSQNMELSFGREWAHREYSDICENEALGEGNVWKWESGPKLPWSEYAECSLRSCISGSNKDRKENNYIW